MNTTNRMGCESSLIIGITFFIDNKPCHSSQEYYFLFKETEFDDGNWKPWEIALLVVGVLLLVAVIVGGAVYAWQKLKPG